jgi:hypothetical protein
MEQWILHTRGSTRIVATTGGGFLTPVVDAALSFWYRRLPVTDPGGGRGIACVGTVWLERVGPRGSAYLVFERGPNCE